MLGDSRAPPPWGGWGACHPLETRYRPTSVVTLNVVALGQIDWALVGCSDNSGNAGAPPPWDGGVTKAAEIRYRTKFRRLGVGGGWGVRRMTDTLKPRRVRSHLCYGIRFSRCR